MTSKDALKRLGYGPDEVKYDYWKKQLTLHLTSKGYFRVVDGTYTKPAPVRAVKTEGGIGAVTNQADIDAWIAADNYCQSAIFNALSVRESNHVVSCDSARSMWTTIEKVHSTASTLNKNHTMSQFHNYRHKEGDTLMSTYLTMETMANQLSSMGSKLPGDAVVTAIISSLPEKYKTFRQGWNLLDSSSQTMENLMSKLKYLDLDNKIENDKNEVEEDDQNLFIAKRG